MPVRVRQSDAAHCAMVDETSEEHLLRLLHHCCFEIDRIYMNGRACKVYGQALKHGYCLFPPCEDLPPLLAFPNQ